MAIATGGDTLTLKKCKKIKKKDTHRLVSSSKTLLSVVALIEGWGKTGTGTGTGTGT